MTKLDALQNLLAKVDAGDASWSADFMGEERNTLVLAAWNGSLDAAKALHEAVLAGWFVHDMGNNSRSMGWTIVIVSERGKYMSSHEARDCRQEKEINQ